MERCRTLRPHPAENGYLKVCGSAPCYAVLDVLDDNDDILFSYDLPNRKAFAYVYRKLHLRVVNPTENED